MIKKVSSLLFLLIFLIACESEQTNNLIQSTATAIIPLPQQLSTRAGHFEFNPSTTFNSKSNLELASKSMTYLKSWSEANLNVKLGESPNGNIMFTLEEKFNSPEAYELIVNKDNISIKAKGEPGFFYGTISLIQLLAQYKDKVPCMMIEDEPAFAYRGMHLDVARHFFPVEFVKQYIDMLALYKMNKFHWHLTEDQGWRIEIKKYPKLQEVAAYRKETLKGHYSDQPHQFDGKRYGGYYTQEEIKEVVKYAQDRFINIIPEIEMPGHSRAALAAYPELGCTDGPFEVATKWGIFEEVYCPKEETFEFLENVLTEVMELFPGKYIHIGGDECPKTAWKNSAFCQDLMEKEGLKDEHELQSYFIQRMEKFLNENGRAIIGWDEILEGGLAPNATVMSWRGESGGIAAAKEGHDVIMTPTSHCYFDYYQSDNEKEPLAIGGFLPLEKVYSYHPVPEQLTEEEAKFILGAQANLWTEYIPTPEHAEYMAYPRGMALAELVWTKKDKKDFNSFVNRLIIQLPWLKKMGINVANHLYDVEASVINEKGGGLYVDFKNRSNLGTIRYSINEDVNVNSKVYNAGILINKSGTYTAQCFLADRPVGYPKSITFNFHKAAGQSIMLEKLPSPTYSAGGPNALINGVFGANHKYGDKEWLGFSGDDCIATIDLGKTDTIKQINFRFYNGKGQWIYPPKVVKVAVGTSETAFGSFIEKSVVDSSDKIITCSVPVNQPGRYLKVDISNFGIIPDGKQGAGHEAWLFVDEMVVE